MNRSQQQLRDDALAIWKASVDAVRSEQLVKDAFTIDPPALQLGDGETLRLDAFERIVIVGAGKASAGMAAGLESVLLQMRRGGQLRQIQYDGFVNVPSDCIVRPADPKLRFLWLHPARPPGVNEPTAAGVGGTQKILELVHGLGKRDLCICLISGGGSALLVAPVAGVPLEDKQAVTRFLSRNGANIAELNAVRKRLSLVKGGGLARACGAGTLVTLVISDVLGDPLDVIASGPTVESPISASDAREILLRFDPKQSLVPASIWREFDRQVRDEPGVPGLPSWQVRHTVILGNLPVAVDAAGTESVERGYAYAMTCARTMEGPAEEIGRAMAMQTLQARSARDRSPDCLISGGEPTVTIPSGIDPGRGGRNQQLVLAALCQWLDAFSDDCEKLGGMVLLSGGTDGEDGPTDAAGAMIDIDVARRAKSLGLDPREFLKRCDAYTFFEATGGLIKTGPTHTNVCDVRVAVVGREV
jgi:glycerate 2-kinase